MKKLLLAAMFVLMLFAWAPQSEAQVWYGNRPAYNQGWRRAVRRHEIREHRREWRHERRERYWRHERREHRREEWRERRWRHNHRRW